MLSVLYLLAFMAGGWLIIRLLMPSRNPITRCCVGLSTGIFLLMWLPALWACAFGFGIKAHAISLLTLVLLCALCYFLREKREVKRLDLSDQNARRDLLYLALTVLPTALIACYIEYTHTLRIFPDGSYHVGQSTYGDLSLHLAVASSAVGARFPLHNSLMVGATMAYPYLSDTFASSMMVLGLPLHTAMQLTGCVMLILVFACFAALALEICHSRKTAALAFYLLFFNGGMGFLYTFDASVSGYQVTGFWQNLETVMTGYYQTPTNQPDPHNLRWVNLICDMFVPQRGILGGWTVLLPCLCILLPPLVKREELPARQMLPLGILAGGLPLIHTHSYLALALLSLGMMAYAVLHSDKKAQAMRPWLLYGCVAAALSLPQLIAFTFVQATGSDHFLSLWFNWANNRGNNGLVDNYLWFYLKNVGVPYVLIILALCEKKSEDALSSARVYRNRLMACGAMLIYIAAETVKFQPNEYDNNKLLYVWFLLCLPMAADYAALLWGKIKTLHGARVLAAMFFVACFASSSLTVARECVSDYHAYSAVDRDMAEYVRLNTPQDAVFLTGDEHLNPISSLAGRTIVCSSDLYLYYHGFNTSERKAEIAAFYLDPLAELDFLRRYQVQYIYVSDYERQSLTYEVNEAALEALFPVVYETGGQRLRLFEVPEEYR